MADKRAANLTEFIFNQTKDFRSELESKYTPFKWSYFHSIYQRLAGCYEQHITKEKQELIDSTEMLNYYSCYKKTLRGAKDNNKKLYDESLRIEIKLKQCIEVKSSLTKSTFDFEADRRECYDDFAQKYEDLYASIFNPVPPKVEEQKVEK
jgi:hypothetical protein